VEARSGEAENPSQNYREGLGEGKALSKPFPSMVFGIDI
jgi:hypothetical protein